jgi:hypothetical protein
MILYIDSHPSVSIFFFKMARTKQTVYKSTGVWIPGRGAWKAPRKQLITGYGTKSPRPVSLTRPQYASKGPPLRMDKEHVLPNFALLFCYRIACLVNLFVHLVLGLWRQEALPLPPWNSCSSVSCIFPLGVASMNELTLSHPLSI